jgi:hypothetical protein
VDSRNNETSDDNRTTAPAGLAAVFSASSRPVLTVDIRKYQALLDSSQATEKEKEEFLRALWSVVSTFVELGFGVHPLQEVCGQISTNTSPSAKDDFDKVESHELDETLTT